MSEMVERVARALAVADGMAPGATSNDEDAVPVWTLYVKDARAAIEAMREPTESMKWYANSHCVEGFYDFWWECAIYAALTE